MRALKDDRWRDARLMGLLPPQRAQTPPIAGFEACKSILRPWCDQVIAQLKRKIQKRLGDFRANHMTALVLRVGIAASVSQVAGQRVVGTGYERRSKNV
jgi:hypothetical protein